MTLAETLDDRASFRRFCGFSRLEPMPERTAFVRFRRSLVAHGLDKSLFDAITAQRKTKAIQVKTGTLVDATIIASASEDDGEGQDCRTTAISSLSGTSSLRSTSVCNICAARPRFLITGLIVKGRDLVVIIFGGGR